MTDKYRHKIAEEFRLGVSIYAPKKEWEKEANKEDECLRGLILLDKAREEYPNDFLIVDVYNMTTDLSGKERVLKMKEYLEDDMLMSLI